MEKIKVLIVDDSKLIQQMLTRMLSTPEIHVVGVASDPFVARDLIKKTNPDVITLDIMMPHMDGITFLKNLMRLHPMPVVMVSALTEKNSAIALEALSLGAVNYISKPSQNEFKDLSDYAEYLVKIVKDAAEAHVAPLAMINEEEPLALEIAENLLSETDLLHKELIVFAASMGGIEALEHILVQMPKVMPPIVIVQHIRKEFSSAFAKRIDKICSLNISEAKEGEVILPSHVYIAPGGINLVLKENEENLVCHLQNGTIAPSEHMPSADVLFQSVAKIPKYSIIGVVLTGMGKDGVEGLTAIKKSGGVTIAQDQFTSVIWGMPGAAVNAKVVDYVVPLQHITQKILTILEEKCKTK